MAPFGNIFNISAVDFVIVERRLSLYDVGVLFPIAHDWALWRTKFIVSYAQLTFPQIFKSWAVLGKNNQALDEFRESWSVTHGIVKKIVWKVSEHIEVENPRPCIETVEWVTWSYCVKFPGLRLVNPMETLKLSNKAAVAYVSKNGWVTRVFEMINMKDWRYTPCFQGIFFS